MGVVQGQDKRGRGHPRAAHTDAVLSLITDRREAFTRDAVGVVRALYPDLPERKLLDRADKALRCLRDAGAIVEDRRERVPGARRPLVVWSLPRAANDSGAMLQALLCGRRV